MIAELMQARLGIGTNAIRQVLCLFEEGATVPFIARYRKEKTGSLNEVEIENIKKELELLKKLEKRKTTILTTIQEQGALTPPLKKKIAACWDSILLEDIYLPYKKSRKTKADIAIKQGLESLAKIISSQHTTQLGREARKYVRGDIKSMEEALQGARYIIAAWMNENLSMRRTVRSIFERHAMIESKVIGSKKNEAEKYKDYFNYSSLLIKIPSHRLLAIYRGAEESLLRVKVVIDTDMVYERYKSYYIKSKGDCADQLEQCIKDALKRLILPSIESEFKNKAKEKADVEAILVFSNNLRQLLLASPLGAVSVLGLDPGFRTGCKLVVLDPTGALQYHGTIYPHPPQVQKEKSGQLIRKLIAEYNINHIAIGNGTAGRNTYQFIKDLLIDVELYMVNESGASIYSASAIAREEFPDKDITVRGAVSIGRRLMDPLAELVKIDAKSIGVGQYQHDVNQKMLKQSLDAVVVSCVNAVGINLNTASKHLLQYVAGIGPTLASNIVDHRDQIGRFENRKQLLKVARMGNKAFEQAAGFLRIREGEDPLDDTGVHPERYVLVRRMLKENGLSLHDKHAIQENVIKIELSKYLSEDVGMPTLNDIIKELQKPGLDPRGSAKPITFSEQIKEIEDLKIGMKIPGVINNLTKFGAFVDIGIKESGLIHISQITNRFIKDPSEVLRLNQEVSVRVIELDVGRKRISLSLK